MRLSTPHHALESPESANVQGVAGPTNTTEAKETVDNDVESLILDMLLAS